MKSLIIIAWALLFAGPAWAGKVVMSSIGPSIWEVRTPSGDLLDIKGSKTGGLQEAIDWTFVNGHDLEVIGNSDIGGRQGPDVIRARDTIRFPPMSGAKITFGSVFIESIPPEGEDGLVFDTVAHSKFVFDGTLAYLGKAAAVRFSPKTPVFRATPPLLIDSDFYLLHVLVEGDGANGIEFNPERGVIRSIVVTAV